MTQHTASSGVATPATAVRTTITARAAHGPRHVDRPSAVPNALPAHTRPGIRHGIHTVATCGRRP